MAQVPAASCVSWSSPAKAHLIAPGSVLRPAHGARAQPSDPRRRACRRHCRDRHLAAACCCSAASGGTRDHGPDRDRFRRAHLLSAGMGDPEFPLPRAGAAPGAVGCAVADAGRGAGADVAVEARRRADDGELRRPDGDRSRYRRVPVHDLPQSALVGDRGRPRHHSLDVRAVVARPVPHPPPAGARLQARLPGGACPLFRDVAGRSLARLLRRRLSVEIRALRRHRGIRLRQLRFHGIRSRRHGTPQGAAGGFLPSRRPPAAHHHDP